MTRARDLMTTEAECIGEAETLRDVVRCVAAGADPTTVLAGELGEGKAVTIGADDDAEETLRTTARNQVRRLPVIDGQTVVGIVAQADVARSIDHDCTGQVLAEISFDRD